MWVLGVGLSWGDLRRRSVALLPFFWNHFLQAAFRLSASPEEEEEEERGKKRNCEIASLRVTLGKVTRHYEPEAAKLDWSCCYFPAPSTIHKNLPIRMADNLLDVGPPTAKRPKLNSPLSGSDGPGKNRTFSFFSFFLSFFFFFFFFYYCNSLIKRMCKLAALCMSVESTQLHSPAQCIYL